MFPLIRNDKFSPGPVPGDAGVPGLTGQRRLSWAKEGGGAEPVASRGRASERASLQFIMSRLEEAESLCLLLGKTTIIVVLNCTLGGSTIPVKSSVLFKFSGAFFFLNS